MCTPSTQNGGMLKRGKCLKILKKVQNEQSCVFGCLISLKRDILPEKYPIFITNEGFKMKIEKFDFEYWRNALPKKTSKLAAARKLGLGKNTYNRYEKEGLCPRYVRLAALKIRDLEEEMEGF
jgi:hypothetical protein